MILSVIAMIFVLIGSVSASDIDANNTETLSASDNNEITGVENDLNLLGDGESTYSALSDQIGQLSSTNKNITLKHAYYKYDGAQPISITVADSVIDGNGSTIDMAGSTIRAFEVKASGVTIKNLTIKNANYNGDGGAIYFNSDASSGTVTNCNFTSNKAWYGGAIDFDGTGTVTNCNFTSNEATYGHGGVNGGAIWMSSGSVENCNFTGNKATGKDCYGGAIYMSSGSVENCNFTGNEAWFGGAIRMRSGNVTNCNFTENKATGYDSWGGAIYMISGTVTNCNFTENKADYRGGAVYFNSNGNVTNCNFTSNEAWYGGAIDFEGTGTVTNCNFTENKASGEYGDGGAVYFRGNGNVTNCNFTGNKATGKDCYGGAVYFRGNGNVTNCNFTSNEAKKDGGAIWMSSGSVENCNFTSNEAKFDGGAIHMSSGSVENCNFTSNEAKLYGGAIWMYSGSVENCNFTENKADYPGGAVYFNSNGNVTNCNFANNFAREGGAIFSHNWYTAADTCIFKTESDTINNNVIIFSPVLNVDNFTATYGSGKKFNLTTNSGMPVDNGNISISVYCKNNDSWVGNYSCLSGEGWTVDLPVGSYYAVFDTEYAEFKPINRSIKVIPNIEYYANLTPVTTNNLTVNITAKSNIPQDIVEGKLLFILPNTTKINATYGADGIWWALHTFDDAGDYNISASYDELDDVIINNATIIIRYDASVDVNNKTLDLFVGDNFTIVATTTPEGLNVTYVQDDSGVYIVDENGVVTALKNGTGSVLVKVGGDGVYAENSTIVNVTVTKVPTEIKVTNATLDLKVDGEIETGATLTPSDAGNLTYTVSNPSIVKVEDGKIIALKEGNATITVSFAGDDKYLAAENKTITVTVSLNDASVTVNNDTLNLFVDDTFNLVAATEPKDLTVNFTSSNPSVVTVDNKGNVVAVSEGTAIITVSVGGDGIYAENSTEVTVNVSKIATEITLTNETIELKAYKSIGDLATLNPVNAGNLTYTSSNEDIILVSDDGIIYARIKGTATVTVSFAGDDKYKAAESKNITVTVTLNDASVSVENDTLDLFVDDTYIINATADPRFLAVNYTSSNESVATVTEYGNIKAIGEGTAVITLTVGNGETYAVNSTNVTVTVSKVPTEITVDPDSLDLSVGDETVIVAALTPAEAGNLTYTSSDESVVTVDADGKVTAVGEGSATISVSYAGDNKYAPSNATVNVAVSKDTFEPEVATNDTAVTVNVPEDATGNVTLTVGNETFTAPIENGVATFDVSNLPSGDYNATISYPGDDKYEGFEFECPISIEDQFILSADNLTKYYHGFERFVVNLTDGKGNPIANATVNININGVSYNRTTDSNGQASMAVNLNSGEYPVVVSYNGTSVDTTITVLSTVNGTDVVKMYRNGTQYFATFLDSEGNYLADGTAVKFNINGVMYERKVSGGKGQAKLNINLEQGEYIITAINNVTGENAANNITVLSLLTENNDLTKYYRNASQYTVKVLGEDGNPVGAGVTVKFNINGVFYERQTNASGIAKLNINLQSGDYVITAEYNGCSVSNDIKVLPVLNASDISMKYRDGTKFVATLVDGQGNPFPDQKVEFNVNGVLYYRTTDSNGQAKLNINLMAGEYIITSSYNGASISNKITISG